MRRDDVARQPQRGKRGLAQVVVEHAGMLDNDLREAALAALRLPRDVVAAHALDASWKRATAQFVDNLQPLYARS